MQGKPFKNFAMEEIDSNYKKAFNLGYEVAKELKLTKPLFKKENQSTEATNPIQAGMLQYINENPISKSQDVTEKIIKPMTRIKSKNLGKGIGF